MKKGIALLLATLMCLSLTACGGTGEQSSGQDSSGEDTAAPDYPTTNISCIIPYGAGGTMDQLSRALFQSLSEDALPSNVNFVVENVAGGGGLVGTEQGLTRAADGYTIVGVNGDLIINRAIGATDIVLQEDFTPIVCLQDEPYCLIGPADGDCSTLEGFINKLSSGDNACLLYTSPSPRDS